MPAAPPIARLPLRRWLKEGTRTLHDRLDASVEEGEYLAEDANYARFLQAQYSARAAIEAWAARHMPDALRPPPTAQLIASDLRDLGVGCPMPRAFAPPSDADSLGVAWAIGGSAMGNKTLLLRRRLAGAVMAERFLSDPAGAAYFRSLLPRLAAPASEAEAQPAIEAAAAVFELFLATVANHAKATA